MSTESNRRPYRIVTIGAAFTANKGSASMLQALLDALPGLLGACRFDVLTTYPEEDLDERPGSEVTVVSYRPRELVFPLLPLAVGIALSRFLGLSRRPLCLHPALRSMIEADVVADLAGISFVDRRPFPILVYNVLMTGIPLLVGARVVKCSQAVGPFRRPVNRAAARAILRRLEAVTARGSSSYESLQELGIRRARRATDMAFAMHMSDSSRRSATRVLEGLGVPERFVAVVPSCVVERQCRSAGIDYRARMAAFIEQIVEAGTSVVLLPHAARAGHSASRMNDLPLVVELGAMIAHERCFLVDRSLAPDVLRGIIGRARQLVTSRFHAMISALATETPVLVVGWSHKYDEALRDFGLARWALDFSLLAGDEPFDRFEELRRESSAIRAQIARHLPEAREQAWGSFTAVARVARGEAVGA